MFHDTEPFYKTDNPEVLYTRTLINTGGGQHSYSSRERPSDIGNLWSCQFDTCIEKHQAQIFKSDTIEKNTFLQFSECFKGNEILRSAIFKG